MNSSRVVQDVLANSKYAFWFTSGFPEGSISTPGFQRDGNLGTHMHTGQTLTLAAIQGRGKKGDDFVAAGLSALPPEAA